MDIYSTLKEYTNNITVYDPWANPDAVKYEYGISIVSTLPNDRKFDAIILAVAHKEFLNLNLKNLKEYETSVIYDVKGIVHRDIIDGRL